MARKKWKQPAITLYQGETTVETEHVSVFLRYRRWLLKLNPVLLPPAWRREHRKIIISNGKKVGWAETRFGLIPIRSRVSRPRRPFRKLKSFVRKWLGIGCLSYERGYVLVGIGQFRYAVLQSTTPSGYTLCEVYDIQEQEPIGRFYFNQELTEVYLVANVGGVANTLQVISGYIADALVYSKAAVTLNRTIKLVFQ